MGISQYLHLQGSRRTQIGLEDILETLSGANVDLQGLSSPLDEMLVRATEGSIEGGIMTYPGLRLRVKQLGCRHICSRMNERELDPKESQKEDGMELVEHRSGQPSFGGGRR